MRISDWSSDVCSSDLFPDWFGRNWDALADCLGDLSWWPAEGYLLLLDHADAWRAAETDQFTTLLEILDAAARTWSAQRVPFWALVPLPAQALDEVEIGRASCRARVCQYV